MFVTSHDCTDCSDMDDEKKRDMVPSEENAFFFLYKKRIKSMSRRLVQSRFVKPGETILECHHRPESSL